jgi:hypothetical protein
LPVHPVQVFAAPLQNGVTPAHSASATLVHWTQTLSEHTGVLPEQSLLTLQPPKGMHALFAEHTPLRQTVPPLLLVQIPVPSA